MILNSSDAVNDGSCVVITPQWYYGISLHIYAIILLIKLNKVVALACDISMYK